MSAGDARTRGAQPQHSHRAGHAQRGEGDSRRAQRLLRRRKNARANAPQRAQCSRRTTRTRRAAVPRAVSQRTSSSEVFTSKAMIQRPAPDFESIAVVDGEFSTIKLSSFIGAPAPLSPAARAAAPLTLTHARTSYLAMRTRTTGSYVVLFFYPYDLCGSAAPRHPPPADRALTGRRVPGNVPRPRAAGGAAATARSCARPRSSPSRTASTSSEPSTRTYAPVARSAGAAGLPSAATC